LDWIYVRNLPYIDLTKLLTKLPVTGFTELLSDPLINKTETRNVYGRKNGRRKRYENDKAEQERDEL
jgi:hypothetical protein